MDDKKLFKKRVQDFSKEFAIKHGFKLLKRTFLIRSRANLLQMICFNFQGSSMHCHIAIQPLYIPASFLHFTYGNRLNYFKTQEKGTWGTDVTKIDNDIDRIMSLLEKNVMPFFDEVSSPETFINYTVALKHKASLFNDVMCAPYFAEIYKGYSYLYMKGYEEAKRCFGKAIELSTDRIGEDERVALMVSLITDIDDKNYEKIDSRLNEFISYTVSECGIENLVVT